MKSVLFLSYHDYSNLCQNFARSLQSVGIRSEALCLVPHQYKYTDQGRLVTVNEMIDAIPQYDVIVIGHSQPFILNLCKHSGKELVPLHTGTIYRRDPEKMNRIFNPFCNKTLCDSPEFMSLGANDIKYVAAAINTDEIQAASDTNTEITFGHFPSLGGFKGTEKIKEMMATMPHIRFTCDENIVPHQENLKRIAACSVYIEMFAPEQEGHEYGSAGSTAWEAAALGRVVITNTLHREVYERAYGHLPFMICNTEQDFKDCVQFLHRNPDTVRKLQQQHRKWIEEKHNFEATGNYLKKILL